MTVAPNDFVHLHLHSEFSLLDGLGRINDLAEQGKAIVMISSELPEIMRMSHRIIVMCEGRITGELSAVDATQEAVMQLATQREAIVAIPAKRPAVAGVSAENAQKGGRHE